jgi:invasion protein IalB
MPADLNEYFARFQLVEPAKVTIVLDWNDATNDLDLVLMDEGNKVIASSEGVTTTEQIERTLEPGSYFVRVKRDSGSSLVEFQLTLSGAGSALRAPPAEPRAPERGAGMAPPAATAIKEPALPGEVKERHGDWVVGTRQREGKTWCFAMTTATNQTPANWRTEKAYILFQVTESDPKVAFQFDVMEHWKSDGTFTGTVSDGSEIPIMNENGWLKTLERCGQRPSEMCVSDVGLRGLSSGRSLEIAGAAASGSPARITYSLRGYREAIQAMNAACKNDSFTGWLLK